MDSREDRLAGGALNAALADAVGGMVAEFTGRRASRSRAFVDDDIVVCLLEDRATKSERKLVEAGKAELVRLQSDALHRALEPQLVACVQQLTGRSVKLFLSGSSTLGESSVEVFVLDAEDAVA
jgi:uncharacterized protein YbcI